jgi:hypothetical protein
VTHRRRHAPGAHVRLISVSETFRACNQLDFASSAPLGSFSPAEITQLRRPSVGVSWCQLASVDVFRSTAQRYRTAAQHTQYVLVH